MVVSVESDQQFQEFLEQHQKDTVLIDFYANWCGPCKAFTPKLEKLANEFENVKFVKVNVDGCPKASKDFKVGSIPYFVLFRDGQMVDQVVGAHESRVRDLLQK